LLLAKDILKDRLFFDVDSAFPRQYFVKCSFKLAAKKQGGVFFGAQNMCIYVVSIEYYMMQGKLMCNRLMLLVMQIKWTM